jgi:hypothetical protein
MASLQDKHPRQPVPLSVAALAQLTPAMVAGDVGAIAECSDAVWSGGTGCQVRWSGSQWRDLDGNVATTSAFSGFPNSKLAINSVTSRELLHANFHNLIQNPYFHEGLIGHFFVTGGGVWSIDTDALSPPSALKFDTTGQTTQAQFRMSGDTIGEGIPVTEGQKVVLELWLKHSGAAPSATITLISAFRDTAGGAVSTISQTVTGLNTSWQKYTVTAVAPVGACYLNFRLYINSGQPATCQILADNLYAFFVQPEASVALGGASSDPLLAYDIIDEFFVSSNETGEVGQLNWSFTNGSVTTPNAVANRPGMITRTSGATAAQVASLYPGLASSNTRILMSDWTEQWWVFQQVATSTDHIQRYGLFADAAANPSTDGVYLERLTADTTWFSVTRTGGVETRKNTGQAYTTNWRKLQLKKNGTAIEFYLDGSLVTTHSAAENIPIGTVGVLPGAQITPTTATSRSFNLDFFRQKGNVTR